MQGYHFLVVNKDGQFISQGVILRQLTEERYLCKFLSKPVVTRVIHIDEIAQWNLFPNEQEMDEFVGDLIPKPAEPDDEGEAGTLTPEEQEALDKAEIDDGEEKQE